jgi:hypothetical protein
MSTGQGLMLILASIGTSMDLWKDFMATSTDSMAKYATSVQSMAASAPSTQLPTKPDPIKTRIRALHAIEANEDFSHKELINTALIIENNPIFPYMYLSMNNMNTCRTYLLHYMEKVKNSK